MGLTAKQKNERAAIKAGTHEEATDAFGNRYLKELPPPEKAFECIHCGQKVLLIVGKQVMPGDLLPYRHAPGVTRGCPRLYGPLAADDVREL